MNPKNLRVRLEPKTERLILTEDKAGRVRRLADIHDHVMLAFAAELTAEENALTLTKEIRFSDGAVIRVSMELVKDSGGREP